MLLNTEMNIPFSLLFYGTIRNFVQEREMEGSREPFRWFYEVPPAPFYRLRKLNTS